MKDSVEQLGGPVGCRCGREYLGAIAGALALAAWPVCSTGTSLIQQVRIVYASLCLELTIASRFH